jgi:hypothetical protein
MDIDPHQMILLDGALAAHSVAASLGGGEAVAFTAPSPELTRHTKLPNQSLYAS